MASTTIPASSNCGGNQAFALSLGLLLLRLVVGWVFIYHGGQACFGWFGGEGIEALARELQSLPVLPPAAWAWISALSELICGGLVLIGLLTRVAAIPLVINMAVAIGHIHARNGFSIMHNGYEYALTVFVVGIVLILGGGGLVSVDALIFRRGFWAFGAQPLRQPGRKTR